MHSDSLSCARSVLSVLMRFTWAFNRFPVVCGSWLVIYQPSGSKWLLTLKDQAPSIKQPIAVPSSTFE